MHAQAHTQSETKHSSITNRKNSCATVKLKLDVDALKYWVVGITTYFKKALSSSRDSMETVLRCQQQRTQRVRAVEQFQLQWRH